MDTTYEKDKFLEEEGKEETINNKDDLLEGLISKPVEGGNWVPGASLDWATDFGRRSPEYDKLCREDETSFYHSQIQNATIVRTKEQARIVMEKLMNANPGLFHACDTEVMDIKLKEVGPVGNGYVTCLSVYSGPNFDYGLGAPIGSTLWIDNLDDAHGILQEFKPWMEDERFKKIWHNYGFDRHVMWNEGIDCRGFGGDTMHMARLQDTSRMKNGGGGYSLEALTSELLNMRKRPMKEIFGVARIKKDGSPGSLVDVPPIEVLQRDPEFRKNFIAYSCYDAVGTWELHQRLVALLKKMEWISKDTNLFDYYWENMRYFAEVLTDMERRGIRVDAKDYLASVEVQARKDRKEHLKKFRQWAAVIIGPDGLAINPASATQLATFLFGGSTNLKTKEPTEDVRVFKVAREEVPEDAIKALKEKSMEKSKFIDVTVRSIGMDAIKHTAGGAPSVTADVLRELAGDPFEDPPKYGLAYNYFGGNERGHEACVALFSLCAIGSIDTMIANFLTSLQFLADHDSRVHCSLNLNTETGRLSSRRPNLQNQPALEKDKYKIRQAFQASPGNNLIVADYGQLELRLLASMTRCKSMIDAFDAGGDFHSRTAMDMFDHVKQAVDDGDVLLEWDYSNGDPPKPLLKDKFASERRKAKTLNFSIAYGKTAHGLSQDWGVSPTEAQEMLEKWYEARPEVRDWQANTKAYARKFGLTRTLMGRYRQLPDAMGPNQRFIGAAERASINTPIQGGAADVAMLAMNKINRSEKLKRLGWILMLQIHDEVILEGPEETAIEAFDEVIDCMESPWAKGLSKTAVPLLVDGSWQHKNWYEAK
ncbi:DNA/RNA polymerase [Fragilariopsis cylindrus CCMP1102]|uniref:DNA/RNA polymerase n=1 Tax=Fragilariopsis cylindrus CCMP1102 TaxID=635003 RepID=A0A1E7FFT0_9STRA|nr:DNA/RNA polymerase [Fragilariopsis cylindrus CCMP1102]|eukprot:OEU16643.1 DNA/RNA polymerase [Fragilariopsis cylindrus CCMP1102]